MVEAVLFERVRERPDHVLLAHDLREGLRTVLAGQRQGHDFMRHREPGASVRSMGSGAVGHRYHRFMKPPRRRTGFDAPPRRDLRGVASLTPGTCRE